MKDKHRVCFHTAHTGRKGLLVSGVIWCWSGVGIRRPTVSMLDPENADHQGDPSSAEDGRATEKDIQQSWGAPLGLHSVTFRGHLVLGIQPSQVRAYPQMPRGNVLLRGF